MRVYSERYARKGSWNFQELKRNLEDYELSPNEASGNPLSPDSLSDTELKPRENPSHAWFHDAVSFDFTVNRCSRCVAQLGRQGDSIPAGKHGPWLPFARGVTRSWNRRGSLANVLGRFAERVLGRWELIMYSRANLFSWKTRNLISHLGKNWLRSEFI